MRYDDRVVRHADHRLWQRWSAVVLVLLLLTGTAAFAAGDYVYDNTKLFSSSQVAQLRSWFETIDRSTEIEVVVATTDLGNQTIEKVAVDLFEQYKIGKAGKDNGLLILIAPNQRQYRFEVGYGLEGMLPDSLVNTWGLRYLAPNFKEGRYFDGVSAAIQQGLLPAIEKETGKKVTLQGARTPNNSVNYHYELTPTQVGFGGAIGVIVFIIISLILWRITGDPFILLRILFLIARMGGGGGRGGGGWGGGGGGGGRSGGGRSGGGGASGGW